MHILTTRYTTHSHSHTQTHIHTYTHITTFTLTEGMPTGQGSHTYSHSLIGMDWCPGSQKHIGSLEMPGRRRKCVCKAQEEWEMGDGRWRWRTNGDGITSKTTQRKSPGITNKMTQRKARQRRTQMQTTQPVTSQPQTDPPQSSCLSRDTTQQLHDILQVTQPLQGLIFLFYKMRIC